VTIEQKMKCPACDEDISIQMSVLIDVIAQNHFPTQQRIDIGATIQGVRIVHDCTDDAGAVPSKD
jgi:hypothetical protein